MGEWVSFTEIKCRVGLESVLRGYGIDWLRRSGLGQLRGRCPIHRGEGKDAFHVNYHRNVFHCFACGAGGNVIDFVAAMEKCTIRQAALRLQSSYHCLGSSAPQPVNTSIRSKLVTEKRSINPPLSFSLTIDRRHPYLMRRGVEPPTADYFGVGYFGRRGLMSGRIAIPIHDAHGQLVAYCGRSVGSDEPRYRFPADFRKSEALFNYHRAQSIPGRQVIVVEGFFDCMRVHQAGFPSVVALMGVDFSPAQKELLADRFSDVILMLDGDKTGRAASAQIAQELAPRCSVTEVLIPPNTQPDQMVPDDIRRVLLVQTQKGGQRSKQAEQCT